MLVGFVVLYLLASLGIGLYAATRVHSARDFAVAGRSLPLYVVVATVFATWFGSETVLGIPARFLEGGLGAVVEDPFGSSACLVLVGLFFAARLHKMDLLTIGDFYRRRYGPTVEVITSLVIVVSYLCWVSAQMVALGLVFNVLSAGAMSMQAGILLGASIVVLYTMFGGMFSVAWTDFMQMVLIALGLLYIAWDVGAEAGGVAAVLAHARPPGHAVRRAARDSGRRAHREHLRGVLGRAPGSRPGAGVRDPHRGRGAPRARGAPAERRRPVPCRRRLPPAVRCRARGARRHPRGGVR